MRPKDRAILKTAVSTALLVGATAVSGGALGPALAAANTLYNGSKVINVKDSIPKNGEVHIVYFDLETVDEIGKIRKIIPDNPISDVLGRLTNTKLAHCAVEVCIDDMISRFEVTPNMDGIILADNYGANVFGKNVEDLTIDGFVNLLHKMMPREEKYGCIEKFKVGKTTLSLEYIIEIAKMLFKEKGTYELIGNNCQNFSKALARQICNKKKKILF